MEHFLLAVAFACSIAAATLLIRQRRLTADVRRRNTALVQSLTQSDAELRHLVTTRLPELMEFLHGKPVTVSGPLHERDLSGTARLRDMEAVMDLFSESVEQARNRADVSAKTTVRAMMRTAQSLANEQQVVISAMQDQHDDPHVLEGLLKIDHMNAQIGRRAQATAVLCGAWPGQQRSAAPLGEVVRGATSRIRDYLRVQIPTQFNVAVVSRAVEPVVLTVAELLDNAARHSQPSTSVEVNFQQTHNGIAIMIDDAGVAMDTEELQRAAWLLSGTRTVDIHKLGDPPQIGFATAGVLAARYGFTVSVDTRSPYGGVRAVVFLPTALLTRVPPEPERAGPPPAEDIPAPNPVPAPGPIPAPGLIPAHEASSNQAGGPEQPYDPLPVAGEAQPAGSESPALTVGGLPRRRRAEVAADPRPTEDQAHDADRPGRTARETAAGMGAWQRGTRSGRATTPQDSEGNGTRP